MNGGGEGRRPERSGVRRHQINDSRLRFVRHQYTRPCHAEGKLRDARCGGGVDQVSSGGTSVVMGGVNIVIIVVKDWSHVEGWGGAFPQMSVDAGGWVLPDRDPYGQIGGTVWSGIVSDGYHGGRP